jgi:hypothetical protein
VNPATAGDFQAQGWDGAYVTPAPTYTANTVFWQSRETAPGDSVLLAGAFTNTKQAVVVRIAAVPPGTVDWQSLVEASATTVNATNMSSTGLAFKIPATLPAGVFAYRIEDPTALAIEGRVNLPEVSWAEGVPHSTSQADSLAHHVYACGGEAGTLLRIFGKNFTANTGAYLQDPSGNSHALTVDTWTPVSIQAELPAGLSSGNYLLWLGTSSADATSSGAYQIAINSQQQPTVTSGSCPALVGDGATDNTASLQSCLTQYAASATDPNHLVNISIPSGTYVISGAITIPPYEYLTGAGSGTGGTAIEGVSTTPPSAWIAGTTYFGLASLSVTAPVTENGYVITDSASYNINTSWHNTPPSSGHVVLNNVSVLVTADQDSANGAGSQEMVELLGPDIQILNSTLEADTGAGSNTLAFVWGHGALISGNTIAAKNWAWYQLTGVQNVIFEGNTINASAGGLELPHSDEPRSEINQNIYYGNNSVSNVANNSQAFTTDGGQIAYIGNISSVSGNQVTLAYPPDWSQVGNDNLQTLILSIIAGTGTGEYSFVQSVSGQVVTLQQAFAVQPDSASVLFITQVDRNLIFANNTFNQLTNEALLVYGEGMEVTIENNILTNAGYGIGVAAYGPYGQWNYEPTFNVDVINNNITGTSGTYYSPETVASAGIYLQQQPGSALSGVLVRGNTIAAPQDVVLTNGCGDETSVLVEDNQATDYPTWMLTTCTTTPFPNAILVQGTNY